MEEGSWVPSNLVVIPLGMDLVIVLMVVFVSISDIADIGRVGDLSIFNQVRGTGPPPKKASANRLTFNGMEGNSRAM